MNFNYEPNNEDVLKKYGKNLTLLAKENKLDPVINRDEEIRRIIRILSRKTKNNPVLVGEPGVGKTAIIEGLARKIIEGQVPENLKNIEVWELDLTSIIAGASYQGQFEDRLKKILNRVEKSEGKIIIFIDEIHMLIGTGKNGSNDTMDAANILKPMMARGQIKLIGATTLDEYRQYIEKDSALERRMQKVDVLEPTIEDTITILRGIKEKFEQFHKVKITDSALVAAANLSARYISDRFLPDKAIDLIDEAAARVKVEMNYLPEEIEKMQQKLAKLEMEKIALQQENKSNANLTLNTILDKIKALKEKITITTNQWNQEKNQAIEISELKKEIDDLKNKQLLLIGEGKYKEASEILYILIPEKTKKLELLEKQNEKISIIKEIVADEEIAQIVSKWTKIPVNKLVEKEIQKILNLEEKLKTRIKGQDQAIKLVCDTIIRSKANINDPNKPIGSFLFMGSTGVGKTELAKSLALNLFDSEEQIIRVDMSEYMEKHSVSKMIGSPPGYIGYEQRGQLSEKVRQNPYSIILFDEIEKAHHDVLNILLQVLDDGFLTDAKGRKINFKNTIIILTTNVGAKEIIKNPNIEDEKLKSILFDYFKPEFINRLDEIIIFNSLSKEIIKNIIELELNNLKIKVLNTNNIELIFDKNLIEWIKEKAYDINFGARPIKRFIKKEIESKIAYAIISQKNSIKTKLFINIEKNNLVIE